MFEEVLNTPLYYQIFLPMRIAQFTEHMKKDMK